MRHPTSRGPVLNAGPSNSHRSGRQLPRSLPPQAPAGRPGRPCGRRRGRRGQRLRGRGRTRLAKAPRTPRNRLPERHPAAPLPPPPRRVDRRISPMPRPPSSLADLPELAEIIRSYAAPLAPAARGRFYQEVDRELGGGCVLGAGVVARACAKIQRQFVAVQTGSRPATVAGDHAVRRPSRQTPPSAGRLPWRGSRNSCTRYGSGR